jgi:hypothetical protein
MQIECKCFKNRIIYFKYLIESDEKASIKSAIKYFSTIKLIFFEFCSWIIFPLKAENILSRVEIQLIYQPSKNRMNALKLIGKTKKIKQKNTVKQKFHYFSSLNSFYWDCSVQPDILYLLYKKK